jgi:manganese/zinc/iron transport system ATP- binding protein
MGQNPMVNRLWINDLTVADRRRPVLRDVGLSLPEGQLSAVVGPKGTRKSTLCGYESAN